MYGYFPYKKNLIVKNNIKFLQIGDMLNGLPKVGFKMKCAPNSYLEIIF